ncbi:PREDICTED: interleukin-21 receptor-like [Poecilia mexicana]|uniref:Fibronectin type-III domain-containing protein n=1 Tax=Poecilia mexicana TaxID=48701 RepID=A0A3B3Z3W0_9TELE|nr:PREDICTED: interleukin-21 receptor-like [Poecilia mexicana]
MMMMMMMMERRPPLRMKLLILTLLRSTWLLGDPAADTDYNLDCVNNYLFTLNCSLNASLPASNQTYWLKVISDLDQTEYKCLLKNTTAGFFCSLDRSLMPYNETEKFSDDEHFEISLCKNHNEICELLKEDYEPELHIKPSAPCCLEVSHNATRLRFTWKSTYERFSRMGLRENLMYQLQIHKMADKHRLEARNITISSVSTTHSVEDEHFEPSTEYAAQVRSSPNQVHYQGQWSDWSSAVQWRTEPAADAFKENEFIFNLPLTFGLLCALVVLVLVCYGSVRKWKRSTFIPTPAPYFHSLYKDCQGDFKSWVLTQENAADVLKPEEALQVDSLVECMPVQDFQFDQYPAQFQQHFMENRAYSNMSSSVDVLSMRESVCGCAAPLLDQRLSARSLSGYCRSCSPAQDSGCWLCSDTSLEKESSWYCNEYCTLSCLQQAGCAAAGCHGDLKAQPRFSDAGMEG